MVKDLENEIWTDAINFDGLYEVSNLGRVKSLSKYVRNGVGHRLVKERLLRLGKGKDGRMSCSMYQNSIQTSINLPVAIYLSFNPTVSYNPRKQCVMHINKIKDDNRLVNLKIVLISESHKINFKKKLLPHLKVNNDKLSSKHAKMTHKVCNSCKKKKKIELFARGGKCIKCKAIVRQNYYINNKNK